MAELKTGSTVNGVAIATTDDIVITDPDTTAAAWVAFQGSTIHRSYNVSSVTQNTTGDYTITFTTPMASDWYAAVGMAGDDSYNTSMAVITMNSTSLRVRTGMEDGEGTKRNSVETSIVIFQ